MSWRPGACWRFRIWSSSFLETPGHQDQNQLCPLVSLSLRPWILTTPRVPRTVKPTSLCCSQRAPTSIPISHFQIASWKMGEGAEARCQNKALSNTFALNKMEHWVQPCQVLSCHIHSRANWGVLVLLLLRNSGGVLSPLHMPNVLGFEFTSRQPLGIF